MTKQRYDRLAKQRERSSTRSYVTEIEDLRILLAWEAGVLSEGQAAKALGYDRVTLRDLKYKTLDDTQAWYLATRRPATTRLSGKRR